MIKYYENMDFDDVSDFEGRIYENIEMVNCKVDVNLSAGGNPNIRTIVRNSTFNGVAVSGFPRTAIFENAVFDGIKNIDSADYMSFAGAVFRHVSIQGRVAGKEIRFAEPPFRYKGEAREQLLTFNKNFYLGTDWALDISQAAFLTPPDIFTVPGHLIIRDPETQVLITRERTSRLDGHKPDLGGACVGLGPFNLRSTLDSYVFAAATVGPRRDDDLRAIDTLRRMGIAAPEDEVPMPAKQV